MMVSQKAACILAAIFCQRLEFILGSGISEFKRKNNPPSPYELRERGQ